MNIDLRNWPTACQSAGKPSRASVDHALYETKSGPSRSFLANDRKGSNRYTRAGAHRTTTLQDAQRCAGRAIQAVSGAVRTNSRSSEILRRSFEHHSNAAASPSASISEFMSANSFGLVSVPRKHRTERSGGASKRNRVQQYGQSTAVSTAKETCGSHAAVARRCS